MRYGYDVVISMFLWLIIKQEFVFLKYFNSVQIHTHQFRDLLLFILHTYIHIINYNEIQLKLFIYKCIVRRYTEGDWRDKRCRCKRPVADLVLIQMFTIVHYVLNHSVHRGGAGGVVLFYLSRRPKAYIHRSYHVMINGWGFFPVSLSLSLSYSFSLSIFLSISFSLPFPCR